MPKCYNLNRFYPIGVKTMNIHQINSLYQSKVTEIKQRLPESGSVQNKFQELETLLDLADTYEQKHDLLVKYEVIKDYDA